MLLFEKEKQYILRGTIATILVSLFNIPSGIMVALITVMFCVCYRSEIYDKIYNEKIPAVIYFSRLTLDGKREVLSNPDYHTFIKLILRKYGYYENGEYTFPENVEDIVQHREDWINERRLIKKK